MKKGVYAGSFDPPTNGHLWMIEQGSRLFDELVVAVGIHPDKREEYMFSVKERMEMLREIVRECDNVEVGNCGKQYLVNYAKSVGAEYVLRGIRSEKDYEEERKMRNVNRDLDSEIETVFLIPPREIVEITSSFVKDMVGYEGWEEIIKKHVPGPVYEKFLGKSGIFK
ncbi:MAG: pantetheine-phosphate adenylyltransferase [Candidatus Aenigmarchaeota archaeon]|nr:pantetheine-phosphate adenylyltransferase [Candidatus Aenigmarchaeota archaeon]